jgi:hypothetical protein
LTPQLASSLHGNDFVVFGDDGKHLAIASTPAAIGVFNARRQTSRPVWASKGVRHRWQQPHHYQQHRHQAEN